MANGVEAFDKAVQKATVWVKELQDELGWDDRHRAWAALRATLHALRDRLGVGEAVDLGAQLPTLVRGVYYEGWRPAVRVGHERGREAFLAQVAAGLHSDYAAEAEAVVRGVLRLLAGHVSEGELAGVQRVLPQELRDYFPGWVRV